MRVASEGVSYICDRRERAAESVCEVSHSRSIALGLQSKAGEAALMTNRARMERGARGDMHTHLTTHATEESVQQRVTECV